MLCTEKCIVMVYIPILSKYKVRYSKGYAGFHFKIENNWAQDASPMANSARKMVAKISWNYPYGTEACGIDSDLKLKMLICCHLKLVTSALKSLPVIALWKFNG